MNKYKTPGEVGKLLGCSRQNITERCKRLNDEKLAFKDELGWHITEKGVEYLKEHSKKINEPKNEPRASDEVSSNEVIELYKKIIEDKEKQIEKLENDKMRFYELARNLQIEKTQLMEQNSLLLAENNNVSNSVENTKLIASDEAKKHWWQFWK